MIVTRTSGSAVSVCVCVCVCIVYSRASSLSTHTYGGTFLPFSHPFVLFVTASIFVLTSDYSEHIFVTWRCLKKSLLWLWFLQISSALLQSLLKELRLQKTVTLQPPRRVRSPLVVSQPEVSERRAQRVNTVVMYSMCVRSSTSHIHIYSIPDRGSFLFSNNVLRETSF